MAEQLQLSIQFEEGINEAGQHYFTARLVVDPATVEAGFVAEDEEITVSSYTKIGAINSLFGEIDWQHRRRRKEENYD